MPGAAYLADVRERYDYYKTLADRAVIQIDDSRFFETHDDHSNSVAVIVKHLSGNLRSRWRDFLTTDGQKPDRNREGEFTRRPGEARSTIMDGWESAWAIVTESLAELDENDLSRTITIRGEPHLVVEAINRNLAHTAYHVGQIVQLARAFAGPRWKTLSIARGDSDRFDADMKRKFGK